MEVQVNLFSENDGNFTKDSLGVLWEKPWKIKDRLKNRCSKTEFKSYQSRDYSFNGLWLPGPRHLSKTWVAPLPSTGDHQGYSMFTVGDSYKPSFATITGRGDNPSNNQNLEFLSCLGYSI